MNPGTTLFIIIGLIGLMLYALKAIKLSNPLQKRLEVLKEGFASEVNLDNIDPHDYDSLAKALGFPDSDTTNPSLAIHTVDIKMMPNSQVPPHNHVQPHSHIPLNSHVSPIPEIKHQNPTGTPQTISDYQGLESAAAAAAFTASKKKREAKQLKQSMIKALNNDTTTEDNEIKSKCPPMPDMSLYIRRDQIPCWGCNLK